MSLEQIRQSQWHQSLKSDRESLTDLGHQIVELAGHLNAAHYRFLMLIAEWGRSFDGTLRDHTQPLGDWHQLVATHEQQDLHIDQHTAATRWDGESYDEAFAIESLLNQWRGRPALASELPKRGG